MGHVLVNKGKDRRAFMFGIDYNCFAGAYSETRGSSVERIFSDIQCVYEFSYPKEDIFPQDGLVEIEIKFIRHIPAEECYKEKLKEENG